MHYRNGGKILQMGILHDAVAGNDYCNGGLAPVHGPTGACLADSILTEKGLDKRRT